MRKSVLLILWIFITGNVFCAETYEKDREHLRDLFAKVTKALNDQDMNSLSKYLSADFKFTTIDQQVITSKKQLEDYYQNLFKSEKALITTYKTTPKFDNGGAIFISDTACYCVGSAQDEYKLSSGGDLKLPLRWSALLEKEDDAWKIKMLHLGANFFDNPVITKVTGSLKMVMYIGIAVAFVLGIFCHFVFTRIKK